MGNFLLYGTCYLQLHFATLIGVNSLCIEPIKSTIFREFIIIFVRFQIYITD